MKGIENAARTRSRKVNGPPPHRGSRRRDRSASLLRRMIGVAALASPFAFQLPGAEPPDRLLVSTPLGDLVPDLARQDWGSLQVDRSVWNRPLQIGDRTFARGLGTHAASEIAYDLEGSYERFEAYVGVDAAMAAYKGASVVFKVLADGRELFASGVLRADTPAVRVSVPLSGVRELRLIVTDAGDGLNCDHADWAEAVLLSRAGAREAPKPARFEVVSPSIAIGLTEDGEVARVKTGRLDRAVRGETRLSGCRAEGKAIARELPGGGVAFTRKLGDAKGHACTVIERFTPSQDSVRWDVEIHGEGDPWSTAVITRLTVKDRREVRFWTAWSDPEGRGDEWRDPLALTPLVDRIWHYGNAARASPLGGDFIAIPLATLAYPDGDGGVSLALSPEDVLLDMTLGVSTAGQVRFSRNCHRLGGGRSIRFAMDLVGHEADWRGGLRWMAGRYPASFDPPNPGADGMAGCGAYSGDERPIDAARFKAMAFRINWKLSDDFPYMGMFIPPVKDADERWTRSCDEPPPAGKRDTISCREMNDYARRMRGQGFHVLSYFNVTEFGKNMKDAEVPASRAVEPDLWKDPVAFMKLRLPGAYFKRQPPDMCYGAWLTDAGDPAYRNFLLEQARRHIELLPDAEGICIDRMDWLRCYNPDGDDGVSWFEGKPARSLYRSWHGLMAELGPLLHGAGKVVFGNTMTMRVELNRHLDGIYSEQGDNGGALNAVALMGIRKPVLAWSHAENLRQPDPDSFFQRHLYLGAYPTAPYPFNHHSIGSDAWAERQYMDHGPLLDAMRGKKWVLAARCVEAVAPGVKVNLFQVPGGYAIPVTFGGKAESAVIRLQNIAGLEEVACDALLPGAEAPAPVPAVFAEGRLELRVPLKRGCAMVRLRRASR